MCSIYCWCIFVNVYVGSIQYKVLSFFIIICNICVGNDFSSIVFSFVIVDVVALIQIVADIISIVVFISSFFPSKTLLLFFIYKLLLFPCFCCCFVLNVCSWIGIVANLDKCKKFVFSNSINIKVLSQKIKLLSECCSNVGGVSKKYSQ